MAAVSIWLHSIALFLICDVAILMLEFPAGMWQGGFAPGDDHNNTDRDVEQSIPENPSDMNRNSPCRCICEAPPSRLEWPWNTSGTVSTCLNGDPIHVFLVVSAMVMRFYYKLFTPLLTSWIRWIDLAMAIISLVSAVPVKILVSWYLKSRKVNMRVISDYSKIIRELARYTLSSSALVVSFCSNYYYLTHKQDTQSSVIRKLPQLFLLDTWILNTSCPIIFCSLLQVILGLLFTSLVCVSGRSKLMILTAFLFPMCLKPLKLSHGTIAVACRLALLIPIAGYLWHLIGRRICRFLRYFEAINQDLRCGGEIGKKVIILYCFVLAEICFNMVFLQMVLLLPAVLLAGEFLLNPYANMMGFGVFCWKMAAAILSSVGGNDLTWQTVIDAATNGSIAMWASICFMLGVCHFFFQILELFMASGRSTKVAVPLAIQMWAWFILASTVRLDLDHRKRVHQAILQLALLVLSRELVCRADQAILIHLREGCSQRISVAIIVVGIFPALFMGSTDYFDSYFNVLHIISLLMTLCCSHLRILHVTRNIILIKTGLRGILAFGYLATEVMVPRWIHDISVLFRLIVYCWEIDYSFIVVRLAHLYCKKRASRQAWAMCRRATRNELRNTNDVCAVCRDTMTSARVTPCHHCFHEDCLRAAVAERPICPVCRESLNRRTVASVLAQCTGSFEIIDIKVDGRNFLNFISGTFGMLSSWSGMLLRYGCDCREMDDPLDSEILGKLCVKVEFRSQILNLLAMAANMI